jgi:Glycosyl transferase family group 2
MSTLSVLVWLFPFAEVVMMVFGLTTARFDTRHKNGSGATQLIIQITTIGNHETVNWMIEKMRSYELPFPFQIWLVIEPFVASGFEGMDEILVVPAEFIARAKYKARAQEYSRTVREARGLSRHDVKIVMLDDDVLPTKKFLIDVFNADYDVCEGITTPRLHYGRFLSHLDDLRTLSCLTICSAFQGHGHPIWVHGEGLCIRGTAEQVVTWDYPIVASEDLVFGQNAVERGMTWGFVWEYVQLTSPWTMPDFIKQRRRWLWGNIYAIRNGLIPPLGTTLLVARYAFALVVAIIAAIASVLVPLGLVYIPARWLAPLLVALGIWIVQFSAACWIGSSYEDRTTMQRLRDAVIGIILAPITSALGFFVILICLFKGDPKRFEVIAKTKPVRPSAGEVPKELVSG